MALQLKIGFILGLDLHGPFKRHLGILVIFLHVETYCQVVVRLVVMGVYLK